MNPIASTIIVARLRLRAKITGLSYVLREDACARYVESERLRRGITNFLVRVIRTRNRLITRRNNVSASIVLTNLLPNRISIDRDTNSKGA